MTRSTLGLFAAAASVFCLAGVAHAQIAYNGSAFYIQGNAAESFTQLKAGGPNFAGFPHNPGSDDDEGGALGFAVGRMFDLETLRVRIELESMWRENTDYRTLSTALPQYYDIKIDDASTGMANLWFDVPLHEHLLFYFGGGFGASRVQLIVNDTFVSASEHEVDLGYQVGLGLIILLHENVEFDVGYRHYDLGRHAVRFGAFDGEGEGPSGKYVAELESNDLMFTLRFLLR